MPNDPTLFHNKYRIPSTRRIGWDYTWEGFYFVTICTKDKEHYFGEINNGRMVLSAMGQIVRQEWRQTDRSRTNVTLDAFVIMPNHVHGIVVIKNNGVTGRDGARPVSTGAKPLPHPGSLSAIVGSFKSSCTKIIHHQFLDEPFAWQSRFYDHIIRSADELERVRLYIQHNPEMWDRDRNGA